MSNSNSIYSKHMNCIEFLKIVIEKQIVNKFSIVKYRMRNKNRIVNYFLFKKHGMHTYNCFPWIPK